MATSQSSLSERRGFRNSTRARERGIRRLVATFELKIAHVGLSFSSSLYSPFLFAKTAAGSQQFLRS